MIKNRTIIVAGGAGFIGSHIVEKLLAAGNFVFIFDNFNNYYAGKDKTVNIITQNYIEEKDYKVLKRDLTEQTAFDTIDEDIDMIFNLAAQPGVRFSIEHSQEVSKNNIISTVNVLEYALQEEVEKVINASSSSVYGNPVYTPLDEEHPKAPISPYAVSKLCGEFYCDYYYREYGLQTTSLRFYTVYGPRGRPDMAIRKFFDLMLKGKEITIYGDGTQLRDYTYVSDIVNGMLLAGEKKESAGEIFNLGYSSPITVNELVEKMYKLSGKPKKIKFAEKQKGDVDVTYSDTRKANKILNYYPQVSIDEGLKKTFEWQIQYTP